MMAKPEEFHPSDEKELYLKEALSYLPKILELCDKNRFHSTYGSFDRSFWHYRTSDFPSGMYQEAVLPLALAYVLEHYSNPYFQNERIYELVIAGIDFARSSSHKDGSCDDYFPYERAAGATAFSLYACTEAFLLLKLESKEFFDFFKLRGNYLSKVGFDESGVLSNHKALIVLALYNVFLATGDASFESKAGLKLQELLQLQSPEGWFPEYEGCDPGYLTFTIDFLAKYYSKSQNEDALIPLKRAIEFASFFMHPDGSFGGEYGSRNTFHFMPHGFELMGKLTPPALPLAQFFLSSLKSKKRAYLDDDRIFIHYVYNYFQAYQDFCEPREHVLTKRKETFTKHFEHAGLMVRSTPSSFAVFSLIKGGVGKVFCDGELKYSDCGFIGKTGEGEVFTSQVVSDFEAVVQNDRVEVDGAFYKTQHTIFSPLLFFLFRIFMLGIGRHLTPNSIRQWLQKKTILKKHEKLPVRFKKIFHFSSPLRVECIFEIEKPSFEVKELWIGADPTFIYVATSQPFQPGNLLSWIDLKAILPELNEKRSVTFEHVIR